MRGDGAQRTANSARSVRVRAAKNRPRMERGLKASSQRRIVHGADERVQPDEAMTAPLQSSHLFAQHVRITTIPAIRDEEHDRRLMQHAPRPSLMELPQCRADARATGPVRHHVGYGIDRVVKPPQTHLACHTREPGGEEKHLEAPASMCETVREVQQHARVALHRADRHTGARVAAVWIGGAVLASDHFAAGSQASHQGTTQIDAGTAATNPPACPPFARDPVQLLERDPRASSRRA